MNNQKTQNQSHLLTVLRKSLRGIGRYLSDWRNLLGHALLGVAFLVLAIWAPIKIWIKLVIIVCLIGFNIWRMRRKGSRAAANSDR